MIDVGDVYLTKIQERDHELVKALWTNTEVRRYLGGVRAPDHLPTELNRMVEDQDGTYFAIREKTTDAGIGIISITAYHDGQRQELSYQLLPAYWGRGIAARCAQKMVEYARDELRLPQLVAETQRKNLRSRRLLRKLGMEEEQEIVRFGEIQTVYTMTFPDRSMG